MESLLNLKDHVTVVTGASRGIGAAIARLHAKAGSHLALTARGEDDLRSLAAQLENDYGVTCLVHAGKVEDEAGVQEFYRQIHSKFGRVDHLIANAGKLADGLIGMIKQDTLRDVMDVNVGGVLNHIQMAARLMQRKKSGTITVMSSIMGLRGHKGQAVYAASKAALIGLTLSAAKELGPSGIRVNALAPGMIDTAMTKDLSEDIMATRLAAISLQRLGTPEDVAHAALFLSSPLSSYITGQILGVDGGMVM